MEEIGIMKEEKVARDFLENELKIGNPTSDQMNIMIRIVISNNGTMTLDELLSKTKEVLYAREFYYPETKTILNWMLAIAIKNSINQVGAGIVETGFIPRSSLSVNY